MNAIEMLIDDHAKVKQLFEKFEQAGDRAHQTKRRIVEQAVMELEIHAALEEEIFYPAVDAKSDKEGKKLVDEAEEEHHVAKLLMAELKAMDPQDDHYDAKFTVLIESVRHHIDEEEQEMLPAAERLLGSEVERLGAAMAQRKKALAQRMAGKA
ncbi:MAG: hemerythrin domain-containing protein [Dehalococcoidia bacterium]